MNILAWIEFEFAYSDVGIEHVNQYTTIILIQINIKSQKD